MADIAVELSPGGCWKYYLCQGPPSLFSLSLLHGHQEGGRLCTAPMPPLTYDMVHRNKLKDDEEHSAESCSHLRCCLLA
jgi:hypothetical protein